METNADWLQSESFTLTLSAGFFGFYAHAGLIAALEKHELIPSRIVGVSAGALAGGLWASGLKAHQLKDTLLELKRSDFWDPGLGFGGILKGKKFSHKLNTLLSQVGVSEFSHCPISFTAVVYDLLGRKTLGLSEGSVASAIRASCALPFLFRPVRIGWRFYLDGGVQDRPGFTVLSASERTLYHHLPHSSPWAGIHGDERVSLKSSPTRNVLQFQDLPRVGPFKLEHGHRALAMVEQRTLQWLEMPYQS